MDSIAISTVVVPGIVALLLFLVFTYLYEQSRRQYFRAWQVGWGAYTLRYAVDAWQTLRAPSPALALLASIFLIVTAMCIFVSTRLIRERFRLRWYDGVLAAAACGVALWNQLPALAANLLRPNALPHIHLRLEIGLAAVLFYASFSFYRDGHRRNSAAFTLLAISLALWAVLMSFGQFPAAFAEIFGAAGSLLGPIPQMLLGIAMVMV